MRPTSTVGPKPEEVPAAGLSMLPLPTNLIGLPATARAGPTDSQCGCLGHAA
jgi:hypothetical protein